MRDVEVDVIEAEPLDLMVDGAGDDVARRKLGALVERGMKRSPEPGILSCPPSPRTASVIRKFLTSRLYRQVGWNCMNSMLEIRQPARHAMAMPSPVAPRGAVEKR
jgi:hypothetical protein